MAVRLLTVRLLAVRGSAAARTSWELKIGVAIVSGRTGNSSSDTVVNDNLVPSTPLRLEECDVSSADQGCKVVGFLGLDDAEARSEGREPGTLCGNDERSLGALEGRAGLARQYMPARRRRTPRRHGGR